MADWGRTRRPAGPWIAPKHGNYLVPVHALSPIFRAKICAGLRHADLLDQVPPGIWATPWVVHCQPAGRGQKVLDYLGRYIFRVAIANAPWNGSRTGRSPSAIATIGPARHESLIRFDRAQAQQRYNVLTS